MRVNVQNPVHRRYSNKAISPKIGSAYWELNSPSIKPSSARNSSKRSSNHIWQNHIASSPQQQKKKSDKITQQKRFADDLRQQIELKLKMKQMELQRDQMWQRKKNAEIKAFDPFGKPGAGAPVLSENGNIISNYHQLRRQSFSPNNYFFDEFENVQNNKQNDRFLGALNAMQFPKSPVEIKHELNKKQQFRKVLMQQIEEKKQRKEMQQKQERDRERREEFMYNQFLKNNPTQIPSPRARTKKSNILNTPQPSFIPRMRPNINRAISSPSAPKTARNVNIIAPYDEYQRSAKKKLFQNNMITNNVNIPDFNQKPLNGANYKENIKNFRNNDNFFQDLLSKNWQPEDNMIKEIHKNIETKKQKNLLKESMHPSNSVFVFDQNAETINNKQVTQDRTELQALLRSFVDNK